MTLLEFAQGPGLRWAILIMVAGFCARLVFSLTMGREQDLYWARKEFGLPGERWKFDSFLMHAGLLIAIFGFAPHILLIRDLTGVQWPSLPISVVWFAASATVIAMLWLLAYRLSERTRRELATVDDLLSWIMVFAPTVTGMLAFPHLGGASIFGPYAMLLTVHLISVEALMVYLPFGKLMHLILMPLFRSALFIGSLRRKRRRSIVALPAPSTKRR
jgi:nitrate reductase gamma subunit